MAREIQEPIVTEDSSPMGGTREDHPAYGQIAASRVSGHAYLYGSDFAHQHYMTVRISRSQLHRSLSRDWPFGREEVIEVALSEAQWAQFVSTPNSGSGAQCTIEHINRVGIPGIPAPKSRQTQINHEANETLQSALKSLETLRAEIEAIKVSEKQRKALLWQLELTERGFGSSLKFTADQFAEHIEDVTEHAKIEVNAYVQNAVMRAGLKALDAPILIEDSRKA